MPQPLRDFRAAWYLWRLTRSDDEAVAINARHTLLDLVRRYVFPTLRLPDFAKLWWEDEDFFAQYRRFAMTERNAERTFFLKELLKLVQHLDGNTAEAGVYQGGTSWFICQARAGRESTHFAFDSFEGLSAPTREDRSYWKPGVLRSDEAQVREVFAPYNVEIQKGWIPEVFQSADLGRLVFAHVDVDLYEPTKASLEHFYPSLVSGGILVCDDYGSTVCPGATLAFDEFMASRPEPIILCTTGQGFVIKQ